MKNLLFSAFMLTCFFGFSQHGMDEEIANIESKVIEWRRDFHQTSFTGPQIRCRGDRHGF